MQLIRNFACGAITVLQSAEESGAVSPSPRLSGRSSEAPPQELGMYR